MNPIKSKSVEIIRTSQFKRDYKREKKTDARLDEVFISVIGLLLGDDPLPERLQDHALGGSWKGCQGNVTVVRNNVFHDLSGVGEPAGIKSSTDNMLIENNLIYNIGGATSCAGAPCGIGIDIYPVESSTCDRVGAFNTVVKHNTVVDSGLASIFLRARINCPDAGAMSSVVQDNLFYKTSIGTQDGNINLWKYWPPFGSAWATNATRSATGTTVRYGTPLANPSATGVVFYIGPGVTGTTGAVEPTWTTCNNTPGCDIVDGTLTWHTVATIKHLTTLDYNLDWLADGVGPKFFLYGIQYATLAAWRTATAADTLGVGLAQDVHSIAQAPIFVDYAKHNFALAANSPGKNAASDGTDMGANLCTVGVRPSCVPPPNNITVNITVR